MENTTHRCYGDVFNAVMLMFTVMVGDLFLMPCSFCALTDGLRFPAFAEVCSAAIHFYFSVLGCGSKAICFCAEMHMCLPGPSSRVGVGSSLGRRGQGGTGVSLSPCADSAGPRCPVSSPKGLCRAELGRHRCRTPLKV